MNPILDDVNANNQAIKIVYVQKNLATFDADLVEALAASAGPDMFFLPAESILRQSDKIFRIPYASYPVENFRNAFIQEGEIYLGQSGILGLPLTVDPIVMYYNRDLFQSAGIAAPPATWEELQKDAPLLTVKDKSSNILKSAVAFGSYGNVTHAKELLSMLFLQIGDPIVSKDQNGVLEAVLDQPGTLGTPDKVLGFYNNFSNTVSSVYSWNRSLPASRDAFIGGNLAMYFGYASEVFDIQNRNPNLNFDVAMIPQAKGSSLKITYGKMNALAISKSAKNLNGAFTAAFLMSGPGFSGPLSTAINLPPVRRDLLAAKPAGQFGQIFYNSALIARSWLDPSADDSDNYLKTMVEDTVSGRNDISSALSKASAQINLLLRNKKL
jgi:ABC-type glycerol-3-phosphate transport system substrate-binding protein